MEDILDFEGNNPDTRLEGAQGEVCVPLHLMRLAETLSSSIFTSYGIRDLMGIVARNRDKDVYVFASRDEPQKANIFVDTDDQYSYSFDDPLCIPVPKKFAILEPDKNYFEMTLKGNILLSLLGVDEKELHR
ncbi:MAG: hypothetical protein R6U44_03225 [Archaeoglobaceae archaeon]